MFKDNDKYLSISLKMYLFVLFIISIMKIVGLDYFGIDINNNFIINISKAMTKYNIINIWYFLTLTFYSYIMYCLICETKNKKILIVSIIVSLINMTLFLTIKPYMNQLEIMVIDFSLYIIGARICSNDKTFKFLKKAIGIFLLNILYQLISLMIRNVSYTEMNIYNNILWLILNVDYIILMYITYLIFVERRGIKWEEVGSFSLKKLNLKNLLTKLRKNYHNFKKQDRVTKLTYIIYFIFSLIWNTLSVIVILLVARLNDTFIECVFILTSFWLSKKSFGKAFHLSSMSKCFIVSNLSYYILNRITTPLGISIIVPILLGVGLSYVTSKLVKKTYKTLYRGMPEELFEETILKVVDKNSLKYKICYDFYIKNKSIISLAIKYNYTESGIRKIKDRVNEKIKRLN